MSRLTTCLLATMLVLAVLGAPGCGSAQGGGSTLGELQAFFARNFGDSDILYLDSIWNILICKHPELENVPGDEPTRIYVDNDHLASSYTEDYSLEFTVLPLSESETHLFVRFYGWGELFWDLEFEDRTAELFLRWNAGDRFFEAIDIDDQCEIFLNDRIAAGVLQLDSEDAAVYLWGSSGAAGWFGDFAVYRFAEETGYECVLHTGSPHVVISESPAPAQVTVTMFGSWDGFPVSDLGFLPTGMLFDLARRWEVVFTWDRSVGSFIETSSREVMHGLAVVNHFLQALKEGQFAKAAQFVGEGFDIEMEALADDATRLLTYHLIPSYNLSVSWKDLIRYEPRVSENMLAVLVIKTPDVTSWPVREDLVEAIAVFELTSEEPLRILYVHFYGLNDERPSP